jgi:hypothetical protein
MTWIYRAIVLLVLTLVVLDLYGEHDRKKQIVAVIVLVPLVLRLLMLK